MRYTACIRLQTPQHYTAPALFSAFFGPKRDDRELLLKPVISQVLRDLMNVLAQPPCGKRRATGRQQRGAAAAAASAAATADSRHGRPVPIALVAIASVSMFAEQSAETIFFFIEKFQV